MDSFELNKILGAILGTLLFVMGVGFLAEAIYTPTQAGPGYALPEPEGGGDADNGGGDVPAVVSIGTLLAAADPVQGQASAKKSQACHDELAANTNKTGPGLYDVVERQIASHPGFAYSEALTAKGSETWTYENLNIWLTSPKAYAPGTKMAFAGVKDDKERANIIAYLSTLSASPKPFPPPDAAPADPSAEPAASSEEAPVSSEALPASSEAGPVSSEAPMSSEMAMSSEASSAAQ